MLDTRVLLAAGLISVAALTIPACEDTEFPDNSGAYTPIPAVELSLGGTSLSFGSVRADQAASETQNITVQNLGSQDVALRGFFMSGASENYWVDLCERPEPTDLCATPDPDLSDVTCTATVPAGGSLSVPVTFSPVVYDTPEACAARDATITLVFLTSVTAELSFTVSGVGDSDSDGDGQLCSADLDCDDADGSVFIGAAEACDGKDNDCNGEVPADEANADRDLYRICEGDCVDVTADGGRTIYPGAPELCDGLDNDCDGDPEDPSTDLDGDGVTVCFAEASDECPNTAGEYGDDCTQDCSDINPDNFPGNTEVCDGQDNDCDGVLLEGEVDRDRDGILVCEGDTDDDADPTPTPPLCP